MSNPASFGSRFVATLLRVAALSALLATRLLAVNPVPYTEGVGFSFRIDGVGGGMMTVYDESVSPVVSGSTYYAITESGTDTAWLRPGKRYAVNFQASGPSDYWLSFIAPTGYSVYVDGQPTDLIARTPGGGGYNHDYTVELRPVANASRGDAGVFSGIDIGKSITWDAGLGGLRTGRSAGRILFKELDLLSYAPDARARLYYAAPANTGQITVVYDGPSNQTLRQVSVPQTIVDLVDDVTYGGYRLNFYAPSQGTWGGSSYSFSGSPWKTIRVESPGANQLKITETEGSVSRVSLLTLSTPATGGSISTTSGYTVHTFTSSGTFVAGSAIAGVDAIIVAGGGGGGQQHAGGGGAGGLLAPTGISVSAGSYSITVGAGGAGATSYPFTGADGSNSTALGYTAIGGGAGTGMSQYGNSGGSGGGDGYPSGGGQGGSGTSGQGNSGSVTASGSIFDGGGGGGAGGAGYMYNGGAAASTWAGTFAGGGGGGFAGGPGGGGGAGVGGGGSANGGNAASNTGSGGGGGGSMGGTGGNGGSGVVAIRYPSISWQLQEGDGTTWLRTTTHTNTMPSSGVRDDTVVVRTGGTSGTVVSKTKYRFVMQAWGEELSEVVADPDTAALTTTFDYHTSSSDRGNYRKVKSVTSPTGAWVSYLYYDDWNRRGQLLVETRPYLDSHATVQPAYGTVDNSTIYDYVADFTGRYRIASSVENRHSNVTTAATATSPTINQTQDSLVYSVYQSNAYANLSTVQTTISAAIDSGNSANDPDYSGQPLFVKRPDGSQDSFAQHTGTFNYSTKAFTYPGDGSHFRTTVWHGSTSSSGADSYTSFDSRTVAQIYLLPNRSTKDVTIRNPAGDIVRTETHVYVGSGSFALLTYEDFSYDSAGRLTQSVASNGATVDNDFPGGRLTSTVGVDGTEIRYTYDEIGRVATQIKKGASSYGSYAAQGDITTTYTYDGANRTTQTVSSGGSLSLTATAAYDLAGRTTSSTAPGGYTTTFAYSSGGKIVTATFPGGATKITETYLDGHRKSVSGTGVVAEAYSYSIDGSGNSVRQTVLGGNTSAAIDTKSDWLGRTIQETKPGWNGSPVSRLWYYNSSGQLYKFTQPGVADTLYDYDTLGRMSKQGLDVNANGTLDLASDDRISASTIAINVYDSGTTWWLESQAYTYATSGTGTAALTGVTYERLNPSSTIATDRWISDISGNRTHSVTSFDRSNKKVTITTDTPDSTTNAVQTAYNGLLVESTDTVGVTMRYGYDALGRRNTSVDPRTGTTTTAYVSGTNQVYSITDPASVVQATYTYDSAGRVATVTNALSLVSRYAYTDRNEKYRVWGDSEVPVEYGYNALGQQTTLKTYRVGTGWTGTSWPVSPGTADTTTWAYQAATNLMSSKTDAAGKSVNYSYTQAGQVLTRQWARILTGSTRVTTTYGYDASTGELLTIDYNDSTPDVTYAYNRLGQVSTVADYTGTRTFTYNLGGSLELQREDLPTFYGSRRITQEYDTSGTGTIGRTTGLLLGSSSVPWSEQNRDYTYQADGRISTILGGAAGHSNETFTYTYTSNSHLVAAVTTSGSSFSDTRSYDAAHDWADQRNTQIGSALKSQFDYTQDNLGRITQVDKTGELFNRYGNGTQGLRTNYGFNDRDEVTSEQTKLGGTSTVLTGRDDGYAYDNAGNRETVTHNGNSATYSANGLNQYTQRTVPGVFDVAGAAASAATVTVSSSSSGVTRHGDYFFKGHALSNSPNPVYSLLAISDGTTTANLPAFVAGTPEAFSYDDDGNLRDDGKFFYVYDAENRPIWIQTSSSAGGAGLPVQGTAYAYDYLGRRAIKAVYDWNGSAWIPQQDQRFIYQGWNPIAEIAGSTLKSFFWGLDLSGTGQGAGGVGGLLMTQEGGNSYLPMYDALGNVHGMIKASDGSIAAAYEYDAFGKTIRESGPYAASNPFRYSTKYTDSETGLVYYGHRYYSPTLGRFINRDPIEEAGGLNLYGFCGNNGVNLIDLLGMDVQGDLNWAANDDGPPGGDGIWERSIDYVPGGSVAVYRYLGPASTVTMAAITVSEDRWTQADEDAHQEFLNQGKRFDETPDPFNDDSGQSAAGGGGRSSPIDPLPMSGKEILKEAGTRLLEDSPLGGTLDQYKVIVGKDLLRGTEISGKERVIIGGAMVVSVIPWGKLLGKFSQVFGRTALAAEGAASRIVPGGLSASERAEGHLLARHVGQTEAQLMSRALTDPTTRGVASSFFSRASAEAAASQALEANAGRIGSWLSGSGGRLTIEGAMNSGVGRVVTSEGASIVSSSSRFVLQRSASAPGGFYFVTGFPF
jgi:RHS repeat-associated protein